jgi:glucose/arabinose dehydrogenase
VDARGQGGLLDVEVDPNFAANRRVYLSFSEPARAGIPRLCCAPSLSEDAAPSRTPEGDLFPEAEVESILHYGSRLVFNRAGDLFVTLGERLGRRIPRAGSGPSDRISADRAAASDGAVPEDNPS